MITEYKILALLVLLTFQAIAPLCKEKAIILIMLAQLKIPEAIVAYYQSHHDYL